jgi:hypothetical protein
VEPTLAIREIEPVTQTQGSVEPPLAIQDHVRKFFPLLYYKFFSFVHIFFYSIQDLVEPTLDVQGRVEPMTQMQGLVEPTLDVQGRVEPMTQMQGLVEPTSAVREIEPPTPMQECCGVKSQPIFYEPYKGTEADQLVIRVLFDDTFYQILIHSASYKSSLMSFQDILPYLQNKITDPLTTMELNMIPDTERETLTCEMYLVYEKVKGNPICETQKLLFHRHTRDSFDTDEAFSS